MNPNLRPRRPLLPLLALALLAPVPLAHAGHGHAHAEGEVMRNLEVTLASSGVDRLHLDVPIGETAVEGGEERELRVEVEVRCTRPVKPRCAEAARQIELASARKGKRLEVEVKGWPKSRHEGLSVGVRVAMPHDLDLDAEMGVGEFEARGLSADLQLDMGVGEVRIRGREANVKRVDLEVGVGEALLHLGDRKIEGKGFIGRELDWGHGRGLAAVKVECGVGEVDVRLDD